MYEKGDSICMLSISELLPYCFPGHRASRAHQSDPSPDPRAVILHSPIAGNCDGWSPAVWLYLHPAILHSQQYLVSVCVCVWGGGNGDKSEGENISCFITMFGTYFIMT